MSDLERFRKFREYARCAWNYAKEIFACPKRLKDHEDRLKALEANALAVRQIGDVTIAKIDEALRLIDDYRSHIVVGNQKKQEYMLAVGKAYNYVKSLYSRVESQKITPVPPDNLRGVNNFRDSMDACREYLLELRNTLRG